MVWIPRARSQSVFISLLVVGFFSSIAHCSESCSPKFPLRAPWLGADAAYSIPLPDGRSVWIFGDTLYGDKRVVTGHEPRMVRNSIGISKCDGNGWSLQYVIREEGPDKRFQDFFKSQKTGTWYWALDGFYHDKSLWVTLLCIRAIPVTATETLGFTTCGADLAKLSGLERDPQSWSVVIQPLVADGVKAYPSATVLTHDGYAYLFALYESGSRPMVMTRVPLSGLENAAKNLEYLARDGKWKAGFDPTNAKEVMATGNTEMTVRFLPKIKKWIAVMNYPKMFSDKIMVRTADDFAGPWTEGKVVYSIPEMQTDQPGHDPDTFCYAAKEHPEFRTGDSILITYACNTTKVQKLTSNNGIYFPQVVRIPLTEVEKSVKAAK